LFDFKRLDIPDVIILKPQVHIDGRGFFSESFNSAAFEKIVGRKVNFVQDNHSHSIKGVLRGLHYQVKPFEQGKLVQVVNGEIWDIAVDIRKNSITYGHWVAEILSSENKKQLWIPEGFAHGFYVLSDFADVIYKVNQYYSKSHEEVIHWKNNEFEIKWPVKEDDIILSNKDNKTTTKQ